MMQAGAILGPIERSSAARPTPGGPITPVHDLNVPYEGTEEYETPTADMLFPPVGHHLYNNMGCHKLAESWGIIYIETDWSLNLTSFQLIMYPCGF